MDKPQARIDWKRTCRELETENAALKNKLEMAEACLAGDNALIDGLKAELATAQKDAARYRWLRADSRPVTWRLERWDGHWECSDFGTDLDAAIDKELAK
jgi:multidrug resistance efflux pump